MNERQTPLLQTIRFDELFERYVIKHDREKVRKNSWNDWGLEDGFIYIGGAYGSDKQGYRTIWGWINPQQESIVQPRFNTIKLNRWADGNVTAWGSFNDYPGHRFIAQNVTDIPDEVIPFLRD